MLNIDPLSLTGVVLSSSKALLGVTDRVLTFINQVKNVHPSIQEIHEEVESLRHTIDALAGLSPADATAKIEDTGGLWPAAYRSIHDCELTIHQLYDYLKEFKSESSDGAHPKVMPTKSIRRERLQVLRSQVQTHSQTLQLVLQMISAYLSLSILFQSPANEHLVISAPCLL